MYCGIVEKCLHFLYTVCLKRRGQGILLRLCAHKPVKPQVVNCYNFYNWPCQGGTPIITFASRMSNVYLILQSSTLIGAACGCMCIWVFCMRGRCMICVALPACALSLNLQCPSDETLNRGPMMGWCISVIHWVVKEPEGSLKKSRASPVSASLPLGRLISPKLAETGVN